MTALKVGRQTFSGAGNLFGPNGLGEAIRKLAIDNARIKVENTGVADLTDNSTGAAAASIANLVIPTAPFDASASGGANRAETNTALGKFEDAGQVLVRAFNNVRVRLGLPLMSAASGVEATPNTIPAQDKGVAAASGTSAIDYTEGRAAMQLALANQRRLVKGLNEILIAIGETPVVDNIVGDFEPATTLVAIADAAASADGSLSIAETVMDTFLDTLADNIATIALFWNNYMFQTGLSDLTDNSGGTAAGEAIAAINQAFTAHQDGGTDSAPAAALNTELPKIENNFADLALRTNVLLARFGLALLTDGSTGTADTTLEVIDDTLAAVNGVGSTTASKATADVSFGEIADNIASLVAKVNLLCPYFGLELLVDSSGGVAAAALVPITVTTGVDNSAAATGTADADVDAALDVVTDNFATIAAKLNAMTGTGAPSKALGVVAV